MTVPEVSHVYAAEVVSVHDGDTFKVNIDQGFYDWKHNVPVRLAGSNAPELLLPDRTLNPAGQVSTDWFLSRLGGSHMFTSRQRGYFGVPGDYLSLDPIPVVIQTFLESTRDLEKYGRILGNLWVPSVSPDEVSAWMLANKYAVPYDGGKR